jgi:para-nitrobenzyl esterase
MPVAGTPAVPQQPLTALRQGTAADVPFLHGGTRDEMRSLLLPALGTPLTEAEYPTVVRELFGDDAGRVLALYPVDDHATPTIALATLLTDYGAMIGACTQLPALDAATRGAPVYSYEYAQPSDLSTGDSPLGAYHGADLDYFFDSFRPPPNTPEKQAFAARLIDHWITFARTGTPGWPAYRHGTATVPSLAIDRTGPVNLATEHHCDFWRTVE